MSISILTNNFLTNPVPLQLTLNYCSHGCKYCFANINNPKRKADLKKITSQLRNFPNRNDLVSEYLRRKYPVLISNNIDPFSKNNYELTATIVELLKSLEIPIQFNTRGGKNWKETLTGLAPSAFIVSMPYANDETRKIFEPNAPDLQHRFELMEWLVDNGHNVMAGINPFGESFHEGRFTEIVDKCQDVGVNLFWINKLHLTYKQQANMTEKEKSAFSEEVLKTAATGEYSNKWIENFAELREYASLTGANIAGTPSGHYEDFLYKFWDVYPTLLPTQNEFFKWLEENKKDGDYIYFREFYDFFKPLLPDIEGNVSSYIYNKAVLDDKTYYKKTMLSNLLHVMWDSKAGIKLPENYPVFSWVKKQYDRKMDWIKDDEGDRVMLYHPENYNTQEYKII